MDVEPDSKKGAASDDSDPRLDFLERYVTKSLRLKSDKWQKMLSIEDYKVLLEIIIHSNYL